jgi:enamine deaminase RidA (YjgF/YER057c/UK114 family)
MVRMTWYVRDMDAYLASLKEVGAAYVETMGRNYPAMALVEVSRFVEPAALVEIETTAVLPE